MSVNSVFLSKEERARRNVDFYGFWLWHYMMPDTCTVNDVTATMRSLQTMKISCNCRDKKTKCSSCSFLADYLLVQKIFTVFKPWIHYATPKSLACGIKHSADEILHEAAYMLKNNSMLSLEKRFVLNRCGFCVKDVTVKSSNPMLGI